MATFQKLVLGLINRVLGDGWIAFWVFLSEKLAEAEAQFKVGEGDIVARGKLKKEWVSQQVRALLKPKVDRLPFFVRGFVWSGIDQAIQELVDTFNEQLGKDWVGWVDKADDRLAYALEPLIGQDLNLDGRIGAPPK